MLQPFRRKIRTHWTFFKSTSTRADAWWNLTSVRADSNADTRPERPLYSLYSPSVTKGDSLQDALIFAETAGNCKGNSAGGAVNPSGSGELMRTPRWLPPCVHHRRRNSRVAALLTGPSAAGAREREQEHNCSVEPSSCVRIPAPNMWLSTGLDLGGGGVCESSSLCCQVLGDVRGWL